MIGLVHVQLHARVSPMASHESCLLIKLSQYTWWLMHKCASATCKLSGHQMESIVGNCCWNISLSIWSPRYALTTVHQSFLCLWDCITEPREEKHIPVCLCLLVKFVGTCFESIQPPFSHWSSIALRDVSKMLHVNLQYVTLTLFKL